MRTTRPRPKGVSKHTRVTKRTVLEQEIAHMREIAFSGPPGTPAQDLTYLEIEREAIVRARIIMDCACFEEAAAIAIMDCALRDSPKWNSIRYFGRIKRYSILYGALGRLSAREKLAAVRKLKRMPPEIWKTLERAFALRNALAHVYTFDYSNLRRLQYKGQSVLSLAGFQSYTSDSYQALQFLLRTAGLLHELTHRAD